MRVSDRNDSGVKTVDESSLSLIAAIELPLLREKSVDNSSRPVQSNVDRM